MIFFTIIFTNSFHYGEKKEITEQELRRKYKMLLENIQDWPNLKKYSQENEAVKKQENSGERIIFMGNSITEEWKRLSSDFFLNENFINRGIGGQTSPQMLIRFRQDVVDLSPKGVVILCGTNDIAGNTGPSTIEMIENNIQSMSEIAASNGISVYLCSVLPVYDYPWAPGLEPAEKITTLNQWIEGYARKKNHVYIDYHTPMKDEKNGLKKEFSEDGVHPNSKGYKIMEKIVLEHLQSLKQD